MLGGGAPRPSKWNQEARALQGKNRALYRSFRSRKEPLLSGLNRLEIRIMLPGALGCCGDLHHFDTL